MSINGNNGRKIHVVSFKKKKINEIFEHAEKFSKEFFES